MNQILIIDDESDIRELISDILEDEGYRAIQASNVASALNKLKENSPSAIILDIWLEGSQMDGIGLLQLIKKDFPTIPVIMISGHGNIETAVQTIKCGAYDFIEKPFKSERLLILVKRAIEAVSLIKENNVLKQQLVPQDLIGNSKEMHKIKATIKNFSSTNSNVLIVGETGTGKSTIAKMIHASSKRSTHPITTWYTANKSKTELSLELFGGLSDNHIALVEQARHGTLFIDEITNIPIQLQKDFLKTLQNDSFLNPHNDKLTKTNFRIISASIYDPTQSIKDGILDENLYYKLNIISINIPPLRERKQDIRLLTEYFLKTLCNQFSIKRCEISEDAYSIMLSYNWPGNSRELHNTVEWLVMFAIHGKKSTISHDMLPYEILSSVNKQYKDLSVTNHLFLTKSLKEAREIFEREYIQAQLAKFNGNIAKTATFIGMDRAALHRKIKALSVCGNFKHVMNNDDEINYSI